MKQVLLFKKSTIGGPKKFLFGLISFLLTLLFLTGVLGFSNVLGGPFVLAQVIFVLLVFGLIIWTLLIFTFWFFLKKWLRKLNNGRRSSETFAPKDAYEVKEVEDIKKFEKVKTVWTKN